MRRKITVFIIIAICFLLQSTLFEELSFASISPNLLIIITASFGFMRGKKGGLWTGFFCGLMLDIFYGNHLGFYAVIYMYLGYFTGKFHKLFFPDDLKLPLALIAGNDLLCNLTIYVFQFFFRGKFQLKYYLVHIMIPELVYTMVISIFLYVIILKINQWLEIKEKRSARKFV